MQFPVTLIPHRHILNYLVHSSFQITFPFTIIYKLRPTIPFTDSMEFQISQAQLFTPIAKNNLTPRLKSLCRFKTLILLP